ncbi:Cyanovirin-N [Trichoderma evansii]
MKFSLTFVSLILPMSTHVLGASEIRECVNATFNNPSTLQADCVDGNGQLRTSTIDLNECLENRNGILYCGTNGRFGASCEKCILQGEAIFECECSNVQKQVAKTFIELNSCVTNSNGKLTCRPRELN